MVVFASTELMDFLVSVSHPSQEILVSWRWIHAALILATMMLPVLLPRIIEIFSVLVLLDSLEGFATKTSTNVRKIILVATVEHA